MKKQTITLILLLFACISASAQKEYKISKSTGKLHINLNGALIEGYDGNEIIFSSQKAQDEEEDERAKGLQAISGSGYKDNTGLGINVTEEGQDVHVNLVGNGIDNGLLTIRVPKQMAIVFTDNKAFFAEPITIKNIKGEIEVSTSHNKVVLENNSGPMNIKTIHGGVDASFDSDIKGPVSIISVYDYVDVGLPAAVKANLTLSTNYGKLYAAEDFNIAMEPKKIESEEKAIHTDELASLTARAVAVNSARGRVIAAPTAPSLEAITVTGFRHRGGQQENITGTINGGGIDLIFKSTHGNVYLRTR